MTVEEIVIYLVAGVLFLMLVENGSPSGRRPVIACCVVTEAQPLPDPHAVHVEPPAPPPKAVHRYALR